MCSLQEQLEEHSKFVFSDKESGFNNIFPNKDWTKEEYDELFSYIDRGWLVPDDTGNSRGFIINKYWVGEPLWASQEDHILKYKAIEKYSHTRNLFGMILNEHNSDTGKLIYYRKEKLLKMYNDEFIGQKTMSELCELFRNFPELYEEDCFTITDKTFRIKNYAALDMSYMTYKEFYNPSYPVED